MLHTERSLQPSSGQALALASAQEPRVVATGRLSRRMCKMLLPLTTREVGLGTATPVRSASIESVRAAHITRRTVCRGMDAPISCTVGNSDRGSGRTDDK
jgi:hypothetical protein